VCENGVLDVPFEYATIGEAIAAAGQDDIILLAPGTYNEAIDYQGKAITIESSGGAEVTILDGTGLSTAIVRFDSNETSDSVLRGVTLRNGTTGASYPINPSDLVGGAVSVYQSDPVIENCVFLDNSADYGGAAFFFESSALVSWCTFSGNQAAVEGGAVFLNRSFAEFSDCVFDSNVALDSGGALHIFAGSPVVNDCTFTNNTSNSLGGAILISLTHFAGADIRVSRCTIIENFTLGEGGGIAIRGDMFDVRLEGNTICDNQPDDISGDYIDEGGNSFCKCVPDVNGDGQVNGSDLTFILAYWGPCDGPDSCAYDLTGDGLVNGADITLVLAYWGSCQ
jgi:hypothetical protein